MNVLLLHCRFDKHVDVPMPDIGGRKAILDLYGKKVREPLPHLIIYYANLTTMPLYRIFRTCNTYTGTFIERCRHGADSEGDAWAIGSRSL